MPNGSFEQYDLCPTNDGQLHKATSWFQGNAGTADFIHPCAGSNCSNSSPFVCVPYNWTGYQSPLSGRGYAGFFVYNYAAPPYISDVGEYPEIKLAQPLNTGTAYDVSFFVSLSEKSQYAVKHIGAHFSNDSIVSTGVTKPRVVPQVESDTFIVDTSGWVKVSGCFKAIGGEQYMIIGDFRDTLANMVIPVVPDTLISNWTKSYYYIDSVSVIKLDELPNDTSLCPGDEIELQVSHDWESVVWYDGDTSHNKTVVAPSKHILTIVSSSGCEITDTITISGECITELSFPNIFTPNQDGSNDQFRPIEIAGIAKWDLQIYNRWGNEVFHSNNVNLFWDGTNNGKECAEGQYYYTIVYEDAYSNTERKSGLVYLTR